MLAALTDEASGSVTAQSDRVGARIGQVIAGRYRLDALLGTQCPNVLYPYARQLIGELIQAGGFAPFLLQPINFDALYAEGLRQRQNQQQAGGDLASSETAGNA